MIAEGKEVPAGPPSRMLLAGGAAVLRPGRRRGRIGQRQPCPHGDFGSAGSVPVDPYPLSGPKDVEVDQSSRDIYVTDSGNHRVEKFDAAGELPAHVRQGSQQNRSRKQPRLRSERLPARRSSR